MKELKQTDVMDSDKKVQDRRNDRVSGRMSLT